MKISKVKAAVLALSMGLSMGMTTVSASGVCHATAHLCFVENDDMACDYYFKNCR